MDTTWEKMVTHTAEIPSDLVGALLDAEPLAILQFGNIYSQVNGLDAIPATQIQRFLAKQPLYLGNPMDGEWGMISEDARRCLYDVKRTQAFIRGIVQCIRELQLELKRDVLRVVEAGGGTGILAIAAALAGAEVILLEINEETANKATKFIHSISLSDKITIICADATTYIPTASFDILISECLHTGLVIEPQLQIMRHLRKYLNANGKFIPEGVGLSWALADVDWTGIESEHAEFVHIEQRVKAIGQWSPSPYLNFKTESLKENIDEIKFIVPVSEICTNSVVVTMDVVIYTSQKLIEPIILPSGEAAFLGQPHVWKLSAPLDLKHCSHAFGCFIPGGIFPKTVYPLNPFSTSFL